MANTRINKGKIIYKGFVAERLRSPNKTFPKTSMEALRKKFEGLADQFLLDCAFSGIFIKSYDASWLTDFYV